MKYTVVLDEFEERDIRPPELYAEYVALVRRETAALLGDPSAWAPCACPACGGPTAAPAFEANGFAYRRCAGCESLFVSPRPPAAALARFRTSSRGEQFWRDRIVAATAESRARHVASPRIEWIIANALAVGVRPLAYLHVGPWHDRTPELLGERAVFDRVVAVSADGDPPAGGRHAVQRVPLASVAQGSAAVASVFETLEGAHDSFALLTALRATLAPGGRLLLAVVSGDGFEVRMLGERARGVGLPSHLTLVSVGGMSRMLERAGFRLLELSTPGQLDTELVAKAARTHPGLALGPFLGRVLASEDPSILKSFQEFLQVARLSSHMRVVAEAA